MEETQFKVKEVERELALQSETLTKLKANKQTLEEEYKVTSQSCASLRTELTESRAKVDKIQNERIQEREHLTNEIEKIVLEKNKISETVSQEITNTKETYEKELSELKEQVARYKKRYEESEEEKDLIREELKSTQGMVEQETASLRFELSSNSMQLQQTLKV